MSKKYQILPNEIIKLQDEAVRRATKNVAGPVSLYEEWPDEKPTLIVTEDAGIHGHGFCRAVWENKDSKEKCISDHRNRALVLSQEPRPQQISECWLGIHNAFCPLRENSSTITLLGGAFHIRKLKRQAFKRLKDYIRPLPKEQQEMLADLWNGIPNFNDDQIANATKQLELAGLWYSFMITELSHFRYEESQVSHDLLIFLQSLIGNIEVLDVELNRSQNIGKRWSARFEEILKQCEAYSEILGTRLGNLGDPEFDYYSLQDVISDSVELHRSNAKKKWINLVINLERIVDNRGKVRVIEIRMAKDYLSRAFHNILDNAIKYSYSGAADRQLDVVIVGKLQNIKNTLGYSIKVINYGIGIEEDELEKVFEPRYQGKLRAGEMRPGFGVGLSFVKECIELHGGTISIESQKQGYAWFTTLSIWLPLFGPQKVEIEINRE